MLTSAEGAALLYLFGSGPVSRSRGFTLLAPGASPTEAWCDSSEVLWVVCREMAAPLPHADGRWRQDPAVHALAHEMRRSLLLREPPPLAFFEHLARAMIVAAITALGRPPSRNPPRLAKPKLDRVLRDIEARLREPLSVGDLAQAAGLSRARFAAAFAATMGQSPMAYVRARRLERVRRALEAGEGDLARLAVRCGFSSHAHMTTAFRNAFGVSPSDYRARFSKPVFSRETPKDSGVGHAPSVPVQQPAPMARLDAGRLHRLHREPARQ